MNTAERKITIIDLEAKLDPRCGYSLVIKMQREAMRDIDKQLRIAKRQMLQQERRHGAALQRILQLANGPGRQSKRIRRIRDFVEEMIKEV